MGDLFPPTFLPRRCSVLTALIFQLLIRWRLGFSEQTTSNEHYQQMRVDHLWEHFDCDTIFGSGSRPIHSASDWIQMRQSYESVVGKDKSSISPLSGFHVPVQALHVNAQKGRGVYATEPIEKGQLVWTTFKTARFDSGPDYRRFLATIPADFACDVIQWAYVQARKDDNSQTERPFISVDLDEGSFINSYEDWEGHGEETSPNLGCDEREARSQPGGCSENYFALRDIRVGEELLLNYGDFAISHGWGWFGL